jgi:hypothetical protein
MENQKEKETPPPPIIDQLKEYAETQIKLAKYDAIDRSAKFLGSLIIDLIVMIGFVLTFLFLSFALAFYLSKLFDSRYAGFGCVAGMYLLASIILMVAKEKVQRPFVDFFIKKFFQ